MTKHDSTKYYSPLEESLNIGSHAIGLILSVVATVLMIVKAIMHGDAIHVVGAAIFGASLVVLYSASTSYHRTRNPLLRSRMRVVDHTAIYVLIAGTYTPMTLITLQGTVGWVIFGIVWGMAVAGIVLKLFYTGRFDILSTALYVFMGWIIVFAIKPLIANLAAEGLRWLVAGGIAYTVGAVLYSIKRIPMNHAIFHVFVLLGSACHVVTVYWYVLPGK